MFSEKIMLTLLAFISKLTTEIDSNKQKSTHSNFTHTKKLNIRKTNDLTKYLTIVFNPQMIDNHLKKTLNL